LCGGNIIIAAVRENVGGKVRREDNSKQEGKMDSVRALCELKEELGDIGYCNLTTDAVVTKLGISLEEILLVEEWEDEGKIGDYAQYVTDEIGFYLSRDSVVIVEVSNSSG